MEQKRMTVTEYLISIGVDMNAPVCISSAEKNHSCNCMAEELQRLFEQ